MKTISSFVPLEISYVSFIVNSNHAFSQIQKPQNIMKYYVGSWKSLNKKYFPLNHLIVSLNNFIYIRFYFQHIFYYPVVSYPIFENPWNWWWWKKVYFIFSLMTIVIFCMREGEGLYVYAGILNNKSALSPARVIFQEKD